MRHKQNNYLESLTNTPYLRLNKACELLSISKTTLYRLIDADKLQLVKIGERASAITTDSIVKHLKTINAISL
jgi:excisionase family DNA binding protein